MIDLTDKRIRLSVVVYLQPTHCIDVIDDLKKENAQPLLQIRKAWVVAR